MTRSEIDRYWKQFIQSLPPSAQYPETYNDTFYFGITKEDAPEIAPLVLNGTKTATGSLLWGFEAEGKPLPKVGDLNIVTDGNDFPVCIIETTAVEIIPYDEVDEEFAYAGGEKDRTLESWREIYWTYTVYECARIKREPTRKTPLICERFRVVYKESLTRGS